MKSNSKIKWIVYCTTCTVNKKIYIGVHKTNPEIYDYYLGEGSYSNRPSTYQHKNYKFHMALKKYGVKNFIRSTIQIFDNEEDAYSLEESIVNEEFLKRDDVYNMALGGKCTLSEQHKIPCYIYDKDGNFIKEFKSYKDASIELSRNFKTIWNAIKNKCRCSGYFITNKKYDKLDLSKMHQYEDERKIPVFQYDKKGKYECCYDSINDAAKVLNGHASNIVVAIKLGTLSYNKYFTTVYNSEFSNARSEQINNTQVHQYSLDGKYIQSFPNENQVRKQLGIQGIYKAIKLGRTCGGYQWSFEKLDSIAPKKSGKARKVGKYDKDWNLIKEYSSISECRKENGSGMVHVLDGRDNFAKGYRYKYLN